MKREIKFRGKRIDTGKWVFGVPLKNDDGTYIIESVLFECCDKRAAWEGAIPFCCNAVEIDPKTVGQFTGLKDVNEKDIYDGDIISDNSEYGIVKFGKYSSKYNEDVFGWYFKTKKTLYDISAGTCGMIICNIHDNPELMEGR